MVQSGQNILGPLQHPRLEIHHPHHHLLRLHSCLLMLHPLLLTRVSSRLIRMQKPLSNTSWHETQNHVWSYPRSHCCLRMHHIQSLQFFLLRVHLYGSWNNSRSSLKSGSLPKSTLSSSERPAEESESPSSRTRFRQAMMVMVRGKSQRHPPTLRYKFLPITFRCSFSSKCQVVFSPCFWGRKRSSNQPSGPNSTNFND